jgi:hypothetical protein
MSKEAPLMSLKRVLVVILVVFAIYAVWTQPTRSADVVGNGWDQVKTGASSVGDFLDRLMKS